MAFKPIPGHEYYIVAKHSGMVLGFESTARGKNLVQQKYNVDSATQRFRFDAGSDFFWIRPYKEEHYLAVDNSSIDDKAAIIRWHWEPNKNNSRFMMEPAGSGYYRIKALHSHKFLDVYEASTKENAQVVQHQLVGSDNQLFLLIPNLGNPILDKPQSFTQSTEYVREIYLGLVGLAPTVGGVLKAALGAIWTPKDQFNQLWERMMEYVDKRVNMAIEAHAQEVLLDRVTGRFKAMNQLFKATSATTKATYFDGLIQKFVDDEDHFINKPKERLPYVLAYGTFYLAMFKANAYYYKEFHDAEPTAAIKQQAVDDFKAAITKWTEQVERSRKLLLDSRMAMIKDCDNYKRVVSRGEAGTTIYYYSKAEDTYDGWSMVWSLNDKDSTNDYKELGENAVVQRRAQVKAQYEAQLDEYIRISKHWPYFDPEKGDYVPSVVRKEVGWFGSPFSHNDFTGKKDNYITKIDVYSFKDGNVCGLEVHYGENRNSDGLRGHKGNYVETIDLEKTDSIISVYGFHNRVVNGVWFITKEGKVAGGGKKHGQYFSADLSDGLNARLVNIAGSTYDHNGVGIDRLKFEWEYIA